MKIKANGDEYLGIPRAVGEWLQSLTKDSTKLYFPSIKGTRLSENTFSKALSGCAFKTAKGKIVFHSNRKNFSTLCNENMPQNGLNPWEVELALSHRIGGIAGIYNKASNTATTRKVFSWWVGFLEQNGLDWIKNA